eukprot:2290136-Pyramimonas_sp.AAC.1
MCILELNGNPLEPCTWRFPDVTLHVDRREFPYFLWKTVEKQVGRMLWVQASEAYGGQGLHEGVDFTVLRKLRKSLYRQGDFDGVAILNHLASGG